MFPLRYVLRSKRQRYKHSSLALWPVGMLPSNGENLCENNRGESRNFYDLQAFPNLFNRMVLNIPKIYSFIFITFILNTFCFLRNST